MRIEEEKKKKKKKNFCSFGEKLQFFLEVSQPKGNYLSTEDILSTPKNNKNEFKGLVREKERGQTSSLSLIVWRHLKNFTFQMMISAFEHPMLSLNYTNLVEKKTRRLK